MIQAVIFDLDGTLLNTLQDLYLCTNQVLKYYHCPEKSMDEVRSYLGNGIKALLEKALPEQQKHLLDAVYDQFYHFMKNTRQIIQNLILIYFLY